MILASSHAATHPFAILPEAGPVADLAHELLAALRSEGSDGALGMVAKVLDYAAAAERTMADQRSKIAKLEALSHTDDLTGLLNRRGLGQAFEKTRKTIRETGASGLLCYLDVDGFKSINDTHGHPMGDAVLRRIAQKIEPLGAAVARLGGDEFAIVVLERPGQPFGAALEAVSSALAELTRDPDQSISMSIGTALFSGDTALEEALAQADRAMYAAKQRDL